MSMRDYYTVLGIKNSASGEEVKRAYRILARRYHPDINPSAAASNRFREIQEAYKTLSDPETKKLYDLTAEAFEKQQFEQKLKGYSPQPDQPRKEQKQRNTPPHNSTAPTTSPWEAVSEDIGKIKDGVSDIGRGLSQKIQDLKRKLTGSILNIGKGAQTKVSVVELSISVEESLKGIRKKVEIPEPEGIRKVSVQIPPGVRDGSVLRLRNKADNKEDLLIIFRLATHPFISIKPKGLIIEVPITVSEALYGAQIRVPGIHDNILIRVPSGSQSGTEVKVKEKGILGKDGRHGDLFVRLMIVVPPEPYAALLKEKAEALNGYYGQDVRATLPNSILGS